MQLVKRMRQQVRQTLKTEVIAPLTRLRGRWNSTGPAFALPVAVSDVLTFEATRPFETPLLLTTKTGVLHYRDGELRRILSGNFYGLTTRAGRWYAFHRASEFVGQIVSFVLGGQAAEVCDLKREVCSLHPEIHQIDFCGESLYVADPGNNRLLCYPSPSSGFDHPQAAYPNGRIWRGRQSSNYAHINSVLSDGRMSLVVLHNLTNVTGKKSELICLDERLQVVGRRTIDAGCADNVVVVEGCICYCDSQQGDFVAGNARLHLGSFTRGVAVTDDVIYVGGSDFAPRARRENSNGLIYCCSRDGAELYATMTIAGVGGVYEVRSAAGADQGLSDHHRLAREERCVTLADALARTAADDCIERLAVVV